MKLFEILMKFEFVLSISIMFEHFNSLILFKGVNAKNIQWQKRKYNDALNGQFVKIKPIYKIQKKVQLLSIFIAYFQNAIERIYIVNTFSNKII